MLSDSDEYTDIRSIGWTGPACNVLDSDHFFLSINAWTMSLNTQQLAKLKFDYCERIIDGMDMDSLVQMAHDLLLDNYSDSTEEEMVDEILDLYDEEYLEDLMESVTAQ